jgi:6-phosphofructokinase 1
MSIALATGVDLDTAWHLGSAAVERIVAGESGFMTALRRTGDAPYAYEIVAVPLEKIANRVRHLDDAFIGTDGHSITGEFRAYMAPLLGPDPFPPYARFA